MIEAEELQPDPLERATVELLQRAVGMVAPELPALVADHARSLGGCDAVVYLADLQQAVLVPFFGDAGASPADLLAPLSVESSVAGRAYQSTSVHTEPASDGETRLWLPLVDGIERLGVLGVTVQDQVDPAGAGDRRQSRLQSVASLVAQLIMTRTMYGDGLVRLRRRGPVSLSAEMQWGLLPPLSFASDGAVVAAVLEPAYDVAGDTVDYAVDTGCARFGIFDAMGHSLQSAQLAALAVTAYRNARRNGLALHATAASIDRAVLDGFGGDTFVTGLLAELDTDTGLLTWISAGHPEPLLVRGTEVLDVLHGEPSLPFGLNAGFPPHGGGGFPSSTAQLEPGDRVLLYTDGVVEARAPSGEFFGLDRLTRFVSASLESGLPAPEILRRLVRSILGHHQDRLTDDATLLLAEWPTRAG